ncbi:glycosyltransferase [Rhodobacteraceae bacterium]|nr:glycosyltransferase [Paracoccaceae bacterium]
MQQPILRVVRAPTDPAAPSYGSAAAHLHDLPPPPHKGREPLGQILIDMGLLNRGDLLKAVALRARRDVRLGDILIAHGWISDHDLMRALARQWDTPVVDLARERPDPRLIDAIQPETCLQEALVPWRRVAGVTLIACARPDQFEAVRPRLPAALGPYRMVLAPERAIYDSLLARRQTALIRRAESRVESDMSCRMRDEQRASASFFTLIALCALGLAVVPSVMVALIFGWTLITLVSTCGLRLWAWWAQMRSTDSPPPASPEPLRLPIVSVMVPMFQEPDIAARLVGRLGQLDYPRELLDLVLVVEEDDRMTRDALDAADLPRWIRVVAVPDGPIRTKPRALNYALNFCRGTIVGIYDVEDMPDPDQLHRIVHRFAQAAPDVACLQGILDYYNPRTNWLSRCFTVEYATWFRAMLPGVAKLGLVVPLGGTTLFFRREILEKLGCWDAHNVTEDADLGLRLARHGYRTELIDTVTREEANCRALPWVKQRSRWLKGYAITWAVHMRNPLRLWRELGARRFWGVQVLILGALSQYVLAPALWSCWLMAFGLWHPLDMLLSPDQKFWLLVVFLTTELCNIMVSAWAVRGPEHRFLIAWVPTLHFYYPLGALAGWKALYEVITRPFYWDKTVHGVFDQPHVAPPSGVTAFPTVITGGAARSPEKAPLRR